MIDIKLPPEVVEAALEAFAHASGLGIFPDDENDEEWRDDLQNGMRAALIAGLKAWPGMQTDCERRVSEKWIGVREFPVIILPLHQEAGDEHV